MIHLPSIDRSPVVDREDLRRREIYRYLRFEGTTPDTKTRTEVENYIDRLLNTARIAKVADLRPIERIGDSLCFGSFRVSSRMLSKNLASCDFAVLFAVTLGAPVDRLIRKLGILSKTDAFIVDACAAELLETYANRYARAIDEDAARYRRKTHPRFSPGFADFGLEYQWQLIRTLGADTKIHIALTEGGMLIPTKTITAVMGIKKGDPHEFAR